jgi:hypothetical protein
LIQISITQAAFDAIAETLPFGSTMYEAKTTADGERFVWSSRRAAPSGRGLRRGGRPLAALGHESVSGS